MIKEIKTYICVECGKEYQAKQPSRKHTCPECSYRHVKEAAQQLHNHQGPYYEKWKQALIARIERL